MDKPNDLSKNKVMMYFELQDIYNDYKCSAFVYSNDPYVIERGMSISHHSFSKEGCIIVIGSGIGVSASAIARTLEEISPDIKKRYMETLIEVNTPKPFEPESFRIINNKLNISEIECCRIERETKPHLIRHHEFKRVKSKNRRR